MKISLEDLRYAILVNWDDYRHMAHVEEFLPWARQNMHIVNEFHHYALELKERGKRDHYSARAIIHRLRWDTHFRENTPEYKIGNNITPCLARAVMHADVRLKGMFRTRGHNGEGS